MSNLAVFFDIRVFLCQLPRLKTHHSFFGGSFFGLVSLAVIRCHFGVAIKQLLQPFGIVFKAAVDVNVLQHFVVVLMAPCVRPVITSNISLEVEKYEQDSLNRLKYKPWRRRLTALTTRIY